MSLEAASLIIATIIGVLPFFIKVNGEKLPVSLRGLGVVVAAVILFIFCSAKFGFPFDWRNRSSSTPPNKGDGKKLGATLWVLRVVFVAVAFSALCSVTVGFPFDWRDQSSLTARDEGDDSAAVDNMQDETSSQTFSPDTPERSDDPEPEPSEQESELSDESIVIGKPFVESPSDNGYSGTSLANWDMESDHDIIGRSSYESAIKFYASDMLDSIIGSGKSAINADVHIPLGDKVTGTWYLYVFAVDEMSGNGSSAEVTISVDGEQLCPTFSVTSSTTDELVFPFTADGVRDVVLHFEGTAVGSGYCAGIAIEKDKI